MRKRKTQAESRRPWSRRKRWVVLGVMPALLVGGVASAAWILEGHGTTTAQGHTVSRIAEIPQSRSPKFPS